MFHFSLGQSGRQIIHKLEMVTISCTPPYHLGINLEISNTICYSQMASLALHACIDLKVVEALNFASVNIVSHSLQELENAVVQY
jgi:hypothetical protein